ncbi:MAG: response regulator [Pyrinomonadaceae bacterium]|nr:response regulator [Pyrinomonadaceae bacterium]
MNKIRIMIADDERPARLFLKAILQNLDDADIVGEAENGAEAVELIKNLKPDLALLDLQMPEVTGLEVIKLLRKNEMPLIAFVTAYDEFAVRAFEVNAVDYLLKPVEEARLRETLNRVHERLEKNDSREAETRKVRNAVEIYEESTRDEFLQRIPVKKRDDIFLVGVDDVASIVADGELLHISTRNNEKFVINFRLKDLEARLEPRKFIRLSRGALVNVEMIERINPMPGGTFLVTLKNSQEISSSRLQSRVLRERLLKV